MSERERADRIVALQWLGTVLAAYKLSSCQRTMPCTREGEHVRVQRWYVLAVHCPHSMPRGIAYALSQWGVPA